MSSAQKYCVRWSNHRASFIAMLYSFLKSETLVDCTLAVEGRYLKAHKIVLSVCSPFLAALLSQHEEKHPVLILIDFKFQELKAMLDFMYLGEVTVYEEELVSLFNAAENLKIKGLTKSASNWNPEDTVSNYFDHREQLPSLSSDRYNSSSIWDQNETIRTYSRSAEDSSSLTGKKQKLQSKRKSSKQ